MIILIIKKIPISEFLIKGEQIILSDISISFTKYTKIKLNKLKHRPFISQNELLKYNIPNSELPHPNLILKILVDGLKIENKSPIKLLEIDDF